MASINIEEIQKYTDGIKNWLAIGESSSKECLVIKFKTGDQSTVMDDEMVNQTLYVQSRNGSVSIQFDSTGQLVSIELV